MTKALGIFGIVLSFVSAVFLSVGVQSNATDIYVAGMFIGLFVVIPIFFINSIILIFKS